jgi:glycosyltransferase involved in cell wall biosynthesis/2-polyprenyl-3-methyl-5-hydroxy-6-metoxy-1,4-benzoquinol methylase
VAARIDRESQPGMSQSPSCWCGNSSLEPFSIDYLRCAVCETLVVAKMPDPEDLLVRDDSNDFYGRRYFTHTAEEHGLPPLEKRSRTDLPERCIFWLRTLLKYSLPPSRILELGSAHGGFVALMRWAGFDATGLDLSPWLSEFARATFDVPMLVGPVESQDIAAASLDAVVLMDVLEHLGDPAATLSRSLGLLKPGGIIFLQTPQYREGKSLQEMEQENDPFLSMLKPDQHLYLFSKSSLTLLFRRLGMAYVSFEPAIFGFYDMAVVAGRNALSSFSDEEAATRLESRASSRLALALLDLDAQLQDVRGRYFDCEKDSAVRLQNNETLTNLLAEAQAECTSQIGQIETLTKWLTQAQAAYSAQAGRLRVLEPTDWTRGESAELLEVKQQLHSATSQLAALEKVCADLRTSLANMRADESSFDDIEGARAVALPGLTAQLMAREKLLARVRGSRLVSLMQKVGLWRWLDPAPSSQAPSTVDPNPRRALKRVVVDLTPVLPEGQNGGAKVMTIELVRNLAQIAVDCEFILLTSIKSHNELAFLDSSNVRRMCVDKPRTFAKSAQSLADRLHGLLKRFVPANRLAQLGGLYRRLSGRAVPTGGLLRDLDADLLFCPFTAPFFFNPTVPVVSVVYDLQHVYYPQFFEPAEVEGRNRNFQKACAVSARMVCISNYVRGTVLDAGAIKGERVRTIPILLPRRLPPPSAEICERVLSLHHLNPFRYLLYPANFWAHKNHELLLTAFGMYRASNPGSDLKLVLTGSPSPRRDELIEASCAMGLSGAVVFPGYLAAEDFSPLMHQCKALIFPSLFEGFGMPLLEAMAAARPILCGNGTSLPEVAGDAALFFNPMKPVEIMDAIDRIEQDFDLERDLIEEGTRRLSTFGGPDEMAARYLQVFHEAISESLHRPAVISGVFEDGWVGEQLTVVFLESRDSRDLLLNLAVPEWVPLKSVSVRVAVDGKPSDSYAIRTGESATIRHPLPPGRGLVQLFCGPVFHPADYGMGDDSRALSCQCQAAEIVFARGTTFPLRDWKYAT